MKLGKIGKTINLNNKTTNETNFSVAVALDLEVINCPYLDLIFYDFEKSQQKMQ